MAGSQYKSCSLFSLSSLVLFICHLFTVATAKVAANDGGMEGFSVDIVHRDSPFSPFYNASETRSHRLRDAFRRSVSRWHSTDSKLSVLSSGSIQSPVTSTMGEYVMQLSIGTPPVETIAIMDTGSDLTWMQCKPCDNCFKQNAPLFNSESSSTFNTLRCNSNDCRLLDSSTCNAQKDACQYRLFYGDQSFSTGDLSSETFTFGSSLGDTVRIKDVVFGCGRQNMGKFKESTTGIVGLGGGDLSLVTQLKDSIGGKFSYCLVPIYRGANVTSKLNFGSKALMSGPGVVSTPLINKSPSTYYYVTLEKVSVGNKSLEYRSRKKTLQDFDSIDQQIPLDAANQEEDGKGNIVIDSGTTLTLLPNDFYTELESLLKQIIKADSIIDPQGLFKLCYKKRSDLKVPIIRFHFTDAVLEIPPSSSFVAAMQGLVCLSMVPANEVAIFGNLAQMNFLVGYDLVNKKVSFMPTDCSKE